MYLATIFVIVGLVLLTYGADRFVTGAAALARNLGLPPIVIGMTVVGFATSAPEMLVAGVAALAGNADVAVGNALGSNIANIGLVLGATAVLSPLMVHSATLRREYPLMFAALVLAWILMADGNLQRIDGVLLAAGLAFSMYLITRMATSSKRSDPLVAELEHELAPRTLTTFAACGWLLFGLALLLGGSHALVNGAVTLARQFGVSELVVGLTVVAVGTSLPELAASLMSAYKREPEIALGNVIGSNLFNALGVLCIPGLLAPGSFDAAVLSRDFPVMMGFTAALYLLAGGVFGQERIGRFQGGLLLAAFFAYEVWLFYQNDHLPF
jgi:cation:H+ antiporter